MIRSWKLHLSHHIANWSGFRCRTSYFILIYFSTIVKQAFFFLCKSHSNPFLEPTSTKQLEFLAQGNNGGLWWGSNSRLTGIHLSGVRRATHCATSPLHVRQGEMIKSVIHFPCFDHTTWWMERVEIKNKIAWSLQQL